MCRDTLQRTAPINLVLPGSDGLDDADGPPACFVVASWGELPEAMCKAELASAWAMGAKEYDYKVDTSTRCYGGVPSYLTYLFCVV